MPFALQKSFPGGKDPGPLLFVAPFSENNMDDGMAESSLAQVASSSVNGGTACTVLAELFELALP